MDSRKYESLNAKRRDFNLFMTALDEMMFKKKKTLLS
jgi:hypothetical protein